MHEGGLDPNARGKSGEIGMTQIMPDTATHLGVTNLRDPVQQIYGAAKYLNEALTAEHDNPYAALRYYNGGPGWRNTRGDPNYPSYVGGQYQKLAKADTGTMTDATPTPAPKPEDSKAVAKDDDPFSKALDAARAAKGSDAPAPAPTTPAESTPAQTDDPFSAALQAARSAAAKPPAQAQPPAPSMSAGSVDEYGRSTPSVDLSAAAPPYSAAPVAPSPSRVVEAAREAYTASPSVLTPMATEWLQQHGPLGKAGIFATNLANTGLADVNALYAGGKEAAYQALRAIPGIGEQGARDIVSIPDAFAGSPHMLMPETGAPPSPMARRTMPGVANDPALEARVAEVSQASRPPLGPDGKPMSAEAQAAAAGASQPNTGGPGVGRPLAPGEGGPQPQSVGAAATPSGVAGLTTKEEQGYRSTAEGQKWLERQEPGVKDTTEYVPGSRPNLAEIEQRVEASRELKNLKMNVPEVSQADKEAAFANNEARRAHFEQTAGSPVDINNAKAARQAQGDADLAQTWGNKTAADAQPVLDEVERIKQTEDWQRKGVRTAVNDAVEALHDADGNLLTDPQRLYGARKHIDDLLADPANARVASTLKSIKASLDNVIEQAAPGFKNYLKNWAENSKRIDEMTVLQNHEKGLYDSQGRMTYNGVQRMMRNIVDARRAGDLDYQSITPETMNKLWALRDDLRRSATAQELARTPGSDTGQNLVDAFKMYGKLAGKSAAYTAAGSLLGPAAPLVMERIGAAVAPIRAARAQQKMTQRGMQMVNPQNPLQPPAP
jgi:hypothetical protein